MAESGKWVPVSEAERLTGLSTRTIKRMVAEGQLRSGKTQGGHARVLRVDLDKLVRPASAASGPASSVLQNKRERIEELTLEAQELRAEREIHKLKEEDSEIERGRAREARAQAFAQRQAHEETQLHRQREKEHRRLNKLEEQRAEFSRYWLRAASNAIPDWLTPDQEQTVIRSVESALRQCHPREPGDSVRTTLERVIERNVSPWRKEREELSRREKLIENTIVWRMPAGASMADKAQAIAAARSALSGVPITASDSEVRAALDVSIAPIKRAIDESQARARREREESETRNRRERLAESARDSLPWGAAESDKVQAVRSVRSALSQLPLDSGAFAEQSTIAAAVDPIRQSIQQRFANEQEQQRRERAKSSLMVFAELHASNYFDQQYNDDEIALDDGEDFYSARQGIVTAVRNALVRELTGTETQEEANGIAREIVEEELES